MTAGKATGSVRRLPQEQADVAPLRFVSAASLFDGHDAAINIIRRLLQAHGAEVVHLGHNRSVADIVRAAIQEDADGIAVSSYQGGHNEYFRYMVDMLRELGAGHIRIVVGGGGTIAPHEIEELHAYGVERIYSPEDGRKLGLDGMIRDVIERVSAWSRPAFKFGPVGPRDHQQIARTISALEIEDDAAGLRETLRKAVARVGHRTAVVGITGTGGAGKSSLTDELLMRFVRHFPDRNIAVVAMDPTRRRSGGALLGDRIRMNSLAAEQVFMRSLATRRQNLATSAVLADVLNLLRYANFDLDRRRDRRHRPERLRDRRPGGRAAVRDDERVRRREPAREDRHARFRGADRAQQVREAGRRGRAPRRAQAVAAQSRRIPAAGRRRAGLPDHRESLQRPGRQPPVRGAGSAARREAGRGQSRVGRRRSGSHRAGRASCAGAGGTHALPRGDRGQWPARGHRPAASLGGGEPCQQPPRGPARARRPAAAGGARPLPRRRAGRRL